jgi:hypothetical protein
VANQMVEPTTWPSATARETVFASGQGNTAISQANSAIHRAVSATNAGGAVPDVKAGKGATSSRPLCCAGSGSHRCRVSAGGVAPKDNGLAEVSPLTGPILYLAPSSPDAINSGGETIVPSRAGRRNLPGSFSSAPCHADSTRP